MSVPRRLGINSPSLDHTNRTIKNSSRLAALTPLANHMKKHGELPDGVTGSPRSAVSTSENAPYSPSPSPVPGSPKSSVPNHMLYSPKPSPHVRVAVPSPAPSSTSVQPATYNTLPALERTHRYVITGTLQQSLFGVVKLAFDRHLRIQVAIKISRRERATVQQTRSGVSVLENVKREASLMRYINERSAHQQLLSNGINSINLNQEKADQSTLNLLTAIQTTGVTSNGKRLSSRAVQATKEQQVSNNTNRMEDDLDVIKKENHYSNGHYSDNDQTMTNGTHDDKNGLDLEGERYVCRLIDEMEDEYFHYLISEFVCAGDLYSMLTSFPSHRMSEPQAREIFRQIVLGTRYLHSRQVAHMDMSLENICLDQTDKIKIIDFGVAAVHPFVPTSYESAMNYFQYPGACQSSSNLPINKSTNGITKSFLCKPVKELHQKPGKLRYMSHELYAGQEWDAYANDIFSCGVILYSLLTGRPPFQQADTHDVWFNVIWSGQWLTTAIKKQASAHVYTHLSNEALDLINVIIKPQHQRPSADQILAHPWMRMAEQQIIQH